MAKRYSNFHRARKYQRKSHNKVKQSKLTLAKHYWDLFFEYEKKAFHNDGLMTAFRLSGNKYIFVIATDMDDVYDQLEKHAEKYPIAGDNPAGYITLDSYAGG